MTLKRASKNCITTAGKGVILQTEDNLSRMNFTNMEELQEDTHV